MDELKSHAREAFDLAKQQGWDPANLTPSQNRWIATKIRSKTQLVKDGVKAVVSRTVTSIGLRVVSDSIAKSNETKCRSNKCGVFRTLSNGAPVCGECQCSDKFLRAKWKDASQACPVDDPETGEPYWDNTKQEAEQGQLPQLVGDSDASGIGAIKQPADKRGA